jgi:hypothetical protein
MERMFSCHAFAEEAMVSEVLTRGIMRCIPLDTVFDFFKALNARKP